jgi:hypothetical protein
VGCGAEGSRRGGGGSLIKPNNIFKVCRRRLVRSGLYLLSSRVSLLV